MARKQRDTFTTDLFRDFEPPKVVERFDVERVRAVTASGRVARAVSETLRECGRDRSIIAKLMTDFLEEEVTGQMLDAYASPARTTHNIPAHRLIALAAVTKDARLLNVLLADAGFIAVEQKYEALIRREHGRELLEKINREISAADAQWKASSK